jgi:hypothetical protein
MSASENIGRLMYLPVEDIEPEGEFSAPEFLVNAAANAVVEAGGRNWVPLIVKETGEYQYQVVSNALVYAVAKKAALERVWCIVIDSQPTNIEQAKILNGEAKPRVCLNTASPETIQAALKYLQETNGGALKGVDIAKATQRIANAQREYWENFNGISELKCGITKGKKLDALKEVFYLEPLPKLEIPPPPDIISIKQASRDEIFDRLQYLVDYKINNFEKVTPGRAADMIFTAMKSKWRSLNPIAKLDCGISLAQVKTLKTLFKL